MSEQEQHDDNIANLRKAADEGKAARQEAEALKRELAFTRAGIDTSSKLGQMFSKSYDGELDIEAIKAEATEIGAIKAATPPEPEKPAVDENETKERQDLASNSGTPGSPPEVNPYQAGLKNFEEMIANGSSRENAAGSAYFEIIKAAQAGDKRVIL